MPEYEFGIVFTSAPEDLHRGPWSERKVDDWLKEAIEDNCPADLFSKVYRVVQPWQLGSPNDQNGES